MGWQGADMVQICTEALLLQRAACPCGHKAEWCHPCTLQPQISGTGHALLTPLELQTSACGPLLPSASTKNVPLVMVTSGVTAGFPPGRTACAVPMLPSNLPQMCRALRSLQAPG